MEFSIPTNWHDELISFLKSCEKKKNIKEVYGKLAWDEVGGGRTASTLSFVSRKKAEKHISALKQMGFSFNYLLNAVCMDNFELTRTGQKRIKRLLQWVVSSGADSVTVASPYLAMWIKHNFPSLNIMASALANIDSVNRAVFWEKLGAEKITFPGPSVNRNFKLIRALRKNLKCKIQLIANNACLYNCPNHINHALMNSHASQSWHGCRGYMTDYYIIICRRMRLKDTECFIKSDWIRPEDASFYESMGVDGIKLVDRRLPAGELIKVIRAYLDGEYKGNLADLFHTFQGKSYNLHKGWMKKLLYLGDLSNIDPLKAMKISRALSRLEVFIDNKKLNGFIESIPQDCDGSSCEECGYCRSAAERSVRIDEEYRKSLIGEYDNILNAL